MRAWIIAAAGMLGICGCSPPAPRVRVTAHAEIPKVRTTHDYAVPVLMYHRVSPLSAEEEKNPLIRDLTVLPEDFEAQVRFLKEQGFSLLSVYDVQKALLTDGELPEEAVAITLDDGYRDNFEHAFPILRKYGASATIFLVQNTVGTDSHLTWPQIRDMRSYSVRYGSHTVSHADLPSLGDVALTSELQGSKRFLEEGLREPVESLAYPAGRFDDRVAEFVKEAGYLSAWKKGGGPVRPGDDPYRLPRVRVHGKTTMEDFERKVTSGIWAIRMGRETRKVNS